MAAMGQIAKGAATSARALPHSSSSSSQPLFPRLHVNEGDKGGPRAPPRNKMALYEHLTIPSHRFVPGTATLPSTPAPTQGSGYEGRYIFSPSCLAPTVAYSAVNTGCQVRNQSSAGASNDSAVVDGNREMQRAPGVISNGSIGMLSSAGVSSASSQYASSNPTNPSGRKVRDEDDFRVPQYSNLRISSNSMIKLSGFNKCQPTDSCSSNPARPPVVASNNFQYEAVPCSSSIAVREECLQLLETDMQKTENGTGGHRAEHENIHAKSKVQFWIKDHREQSKHLSDSGNVSHGNIATLEHLQNSSHVTDVVTLSQHTIRGECVVGKGDDVNSMKPTSMDSDATPEGLPPLDGRQELQKPADYDDVRGADENGSRQRDDLYPGSSLKNSCESSSEFENSSDGSAAELSVPSQPMQGSNSEDGSDSSMVDSESISKISPDDVIGAIGKQQFWKARKAILRQQRIFSVQVFELHRLIKVQQLMATSPILLIENSAYVNTPFGKTGGEKILSDYIPETKTEKKTNNGEQSNDQPGSNTTEPADGHILQPGVACFPGWFNHGAGQTMNSDQNGQMYVGSFPVMPFMIPGGMSAWGFPHPGLGTHQWLVPMASPAGEFMQKPFPGVFSSPAAFTGPIFGTPGSLGCPPAVAASQGSEHFLEFQPSYGLPGSNLQYGAAVCSVPVVAPNVLPSCYGLPFPMFYPMQSANVHGIPVAMGHNEATQQELAPCSLESMSRPINTGQASVGTPIPCSGVFSHQEQTNGMPRQSIFQDNTRSSSHANQTSRELNTHPQSLYNVSVQARGMCEEQLRDECWQLSEGSHFKETNSLVGEENEIQGRRSTDGLERTSKRVCETDMSKCKMALDKDTLTLFPLAPSLGGRDKCFLVAGEPQGQVIKVVPCNAMSAPESAAGILLSIQQERQSGVNNLNGGM